MIETRLCALALVAALTAACGSSSDPTASPAPTQSPDDGAKAGAGKAEGKGEDKGSGGGREDPQSGDGGGGGEGAGTDASPGSSGSNAPGSSARPSAVVAYPRAGTYVYDQKGYEELCSPRCERDPLPPTQEIDTSYQTRTNAGAVVVTEARASSGRLVRTTTVYTKEVAEVTEVRIEYTFGGFDFSTTYEPSPPPEVLRFPLAVGDEWAGEWSARTSGSYSVSVEGRGAVRAAGVSIDAFRLDTITRFRGELEGRAVATVWVDPATNLVIASNGEMHISTPFGRYNSAFETSLRSAPGY